MCSKNRCGKLEKNMKNGAKKGAKMDEKSIKKSIRKKDQKKGSHPSQAGIRAGAGGNHKFNKIENNLTEEKQIIGLPAKVKC